jgi:hypothetical protein
VGFEPEIFCFGSGRDDHYATPSGQKNVHFSLCRQDLCYFNFLCAQKLGLVSDFNHIFSNLGYVMLGVLFVFVAYGRDLVPIQLISFCRKLQKK